jgi:hypothetical protein
MSARIPIAVIILFLSAAGSDAARTAPIDARHARIVDVTAYPDRAEVVREVTVDLPAGASVVQFRDIPIAAEPDSLRITAKGVPAVLGAVTVRAWAEAPKETAELIAMREEVKRLEGELAKLASQGAVASDLREFLKSLRATTAERTSEAIGAGKADPASIAAVYELLAKKLGDLGQDDLTRADAATKLRQALEVARAKLAATPPRARSPPASPRPRSMRRKPAH